MRKIIYLQLIMFLLCSCVSQKEECREEHAYEVIPEVGIGPYKLGMSENDLLNVLCDKYTKTDNSSWFSKSTKTYYFIENMTFVIQANRLKEIVAWGSFKGTFRGLTVDYTEDDLEQLGEVIKHKGEYRILDISKISFGIEGTDEGTGFTIFE